MRSVNDDGHLRIVVRNPLFGGGGGRGPGPRPTAVEGTERLAGNVGYVRVSGFSSAGGIGPPLDRAMTELKDTGALIVDLRANGGGDPAGAMCLAGFFFDQPTLMARIYSRQGDTTTEMSTGDVKGPRYLGKPVFILTSHRTFSAGEAAAYHLKHVAHAITVGEPSGGGAHRIRGVDLSDRFTMSLPYTRPINVVTNGDWETTGVTPEIPSTAEAALSVAHLAALRKLPPSPERDAAIRDLEHASRDRWSGSRFQAQRPRSTRRSAKSLRLVDFDVVLVVFVPEHGRLSVRSPTSAARTAWRSPTDRPRSRGSAGRSRSIAEADAVPVTASSRCTPCR